MRSLLTTLVTTCAVCAAAQAPALAQPAPPAPVPADPASPPPPPLPPPPPADAPSVDSPAVTPVTPTSTGYANLDDVDALSYEWGDPRLASGIGVATSLGGGVSGFQDKAMRNATSNVGGLWDLRITLGTRLPLAIDLGYIGSATGLRGLASRNGTLIGTTVEGALRWNILPHAPFTPYLFGGAGWTRYDVTQSNVTLADSGMNASDNLIEFPSGIGFAWRAYGFTADVRGTYRYTMDQNLVL
jgi:opacity protein-like surface antigen